MRFFVLLLCFCVCLCAKDSLTHFIEQSYMHAYKDYDLHITQISLQIPPSAKDLPDLSCAAPNLCTLSANALSKSSGTLIAKIHNGTSVLSVPIAYNIEAELTIIKTTGLISTNVNITTQNTATTRAKLSALTSTKLLPQSALGKVSARSLIGSGGLITLDKVKERVLVRKGEMITGIIRSDNLTLQTQVQALQNGSQGDIIKVRNQSTQKILRAQIIDESTAEIL
ncbi:flagellar basal body P-ring formation chaperone FlgA [Helicobacter zhangjianzhongii]|uniref:Flagellar basal body P-ring formation chaperone FlgA n=1 Tax=Helicobacter zhangjianzhongii TaxID=2974574 RepID=A0ACC6FR35_9HELI|nr:MULTISPECIES: flagellar basal body P-ring formation chaperone FlgA [unclassified Helicobacter]MDL0079494.1 flagellar basal body P-ring formation chaperone FlgA [Helicobacter sp. CPD2-1]MDL0081605.1 flagellar basal body P-ring formation chaperone FlgA [Helicobacter sp. XJK30-2]